MTPQCRHAKTFGDAGRCVGSSSYEVAGVARDNARQQWYEPAHRPFVAAERAATTLWLAGLTRRHDVYICAALRGLGYNAQPMPVPDNEALKLGKEFCNRGQCNPTYYTVGNLIRHLRALEAGGLSREEIVKHHAVLTAGSCGPCRFGMYATEYRKALRAAGYGGLRIIEVNQGAVSGEAGMDPGIEVDARFIVAVLKAIVAADVLNLIGYRVRPFECDRGETDRVLEQCDILLVRALEERRSVLAALRRCKPMFAGVAVDRLRPKPVVMVIGEIWAMTTEGDGNYGIHRFLEEEGAEVVIEPIYNWLFYLFWEHRHELRLRRWLRRPDRGGRGLVGRNITGTLFRNRLLERVLAQSVRCFAWAAGLRRPHIPDIDAMAAATQAHYDNDVRGGEAFLEVGKYLEAARGRLSHLVVSVKPFGCLPSSGVSDGVQSLLSARHPETAFYAIETTGDGRSSVYSRLQMMLFNAHKRARAELDTAVADVRGDIDSIRALLARRPRKAGALFEPRHRYTTTAANVVSETCRRRGPQRESFG